MHDELDDLVLRSIGEQAADLIEHLKSRELHPGQKVSHYTVVERLGSGGMGIVYKAEDEKLHRPVALKFLHPRSNDGLTREQLEREARAASALNHPSICTIHDINTDDGHSFIVMELLDGETLAQRLARGPLEERAALDVALAVASALGAAHERRIVHCDVKPANIFLTTRGDVKVLDFGIAKLQRNVATEQRQAVREAISGGTQAYMSPEQARGEELDQRTDIFSLGAVVRSLVAAPSPALDRAIGKMLQPDRRARYQSMAEVIAALRAIQARAAQRPTRIIAVAAVAALVISAALAAWWMWPRPALLVERDWVLVADIANRTTEPIFDDILKDAVEVQIGQSPYVTIFPSTRVSEQLALMRRDAGERLTPAVARELSERAGIKVFITGSIAAVGSQYIVRLDAVSARTGESIARQQRDVQGQNRVVNAIGDAASALRRDLGESLQSVQRFDVPLDVATTASVEALRAFSQGQRLLAQGTGSGVKAVPFFKRAIELDSEFALAHARLGVAYENAREFKLAEAAAREAFSRRENASERERFQITARYHAIVSGELSKAAEALILWAQTYPSDSAPHNSLNAIYKDWGELEKAVEHGEAALRLVPTSPPYRSNLAGAYLRLSQFDRAEAVLTEAVRDKLDNSTTHRLLEMIAVVKNDAAAIAREQAWRSARTADYAHTEYRASIASAAGRVREARDLYTQAIALTERQGLHDRAAQYRVRLASDLALTGAQKDAAVLARQVLTGEPSHATAAEAAFILVTAADESGQSHVRRLAEQFPQDEAIHNLWHPLARALTAIQNGAAESALQQLRLLGSYDRGDYALLRPSYYLGTAALSRGEAADARRAFQKIVDNRGVVVTTPLFALAHLGLARVASLEGSHDAARDAYEKFFEVWKGADQDLPLIRQAREEHSKLRRPS